MKSIKIFLAFSEELEDDRNAFGNLVRRLDKIYETRGVRIELFEWEDYDAAYNMSRKQDKYRPIGHFAHLQKALFKTAHRITVMQQERVSNMLRRAIDAFEEGNIERANTLLDEMAIEAECHP